jgi:hypothetical protein
MLIVWNNQEKQNLTQLVASELFPSHDVSSRYPSQQGPIPKFKGYLVDQEFRFPWDESPMGTLVQIDYGPILKIRHLFNTDEGSARPPSGLS